MGGGSGTETTIGLSTGRGGGGGCRRVEGSGARDCWTGGGGGVVVRRMVPSRNGARTHSSRSRSIGGDGSTAANEVAANGSFGRAMKPSGSISRASPFHLANVVFALRYSAGADSPLQLSPGASGPQPTRLAPRIQYTSPGLKAPPAPGAHTQPSEGCWVQRP